MGFMPVHNKYMGLEAKFVEGTLLSMKGIVKEFPGVTALRSVDLSVDKGEVLAVIGENGW